MTTTPTPPGWYPDIHAPGQQRYWDGNAWTEHTAAAGTTPASMAQPTAPLPPTNVHEAKARAKAEKAYAKASRPWYKKKRFIIPGAMLALIIAVAATSGGGSKDNGTVARDDNSAGVVEESTQAESNPPESEEAEAPAEDTAAEEGTAKNPYKAGQTIALEGTEYTVTGATTKKRIGGTFGEKAAGVFVVVNLTIENKKNETKTFLDEAAEFIATDDTEYSGSSAAIYLDKSLWLTEMQPDLPIKGQLAFDVPPSKVSGGLLRVEDLFGGGEAYIDLGLK